MSVDWESVRAEVAGAVREVGMPCVLRRTPTEGRADPWTDSTASPELFDVVAVQKKRRVRDANGTLIGEVQTVLTVEAGVVAPTKKDYIARNIKKADVTEATKFDEISEVEETSPAGVVVKYEVVISD